MAVSLEWTAALLALTSAVTWGIADFSGGLASRRANSTTAAVMLNLVGSVLAALAAVLLGDPFPAIGSLAWAVGAGVVGALSLLALYQALAEGSMGLAAPVTGVVAALVPVLTGLFLEGLPRPVQFAGFTMAFVGIALASLKPAEAGKARLSARVLSLALAAGTGFGVFYVLIDQSTASGVNWPLATAKISSLITLLAAARLRRTPITLGIRLLPLLIVIGVLDMVGNMTYMFAARMGRLDVAAVLASLYPGVTAISAWLILKERLDRQQAAGALLLLAAIPLVAA